MSYKLTDILREVLNERYTVDSLPTNILLLSDDDGGKFFLYDINKNKVIAFIVFWEGVDRVYTEVDGYGAFLYECAMTYKYPDGLMMSRDGDTSEAALRVWDKFYKRSDVRKVRMNDDKMTYNRKTLPTKEKYKNNPKLLRYVLELDDTKFYYSFGKEKLNKLIEQGREFMERHGINSVDGLEINMEFED